MIAILTPVAAVILFALLMNAPRWYHFMRGETCSRCQGLGWIVIGQSWSAGCPKCDGKGWVKK